MVKIACVGIGNWGKNLLRIFTGLSDCEVKYCCDIDKERTSWVEFSYPAIKSTCKLEEILEDSTVDALVISTPAETHYTIAKDSILTGKHLFVEKPLALSTKEANKLVELAKEKRCILMTGHLLLYHPALIMIKDLIASGQIGDVYYIYSQRVNLGQVRQKENALWSLAPHDISVINYLLGEIPDNVSARGQSYLQRGVEDVVFASLHYKDRKMAHVQLSWLEPHKVRKTTIVGSKKMVVFDDMETSSKIKIYDKGVEKRDFETYGDYLALRFGDVKIPHVDMIEPLRLECQHFIDCLSKDTKPRSDGINGLKVVQIIEAAQESLRQNGLAIKLNDIVI